jgi:hypothetical protein
MVSVEPAVVRVAEAVEGADVDHGTEMGDCAAPSSVSHVTGYQQHRGSRNRPGRARRQRGCELLPGTMVAVVDKTIAEPPAR